MIGWEHRDERMRWGGMKRMKRLGVGIRRGWVTKVHCGGERRKVGGSIGEVVSGADYGANGECHTRLDGWVDG